MTMCNMLLHYLAKHKRSMMHGQYTSLDASACSERGVSLRLYSSKDINKQLK